MWSQNHAGMGVWSNPALMTAMPGRRGQRIISIGSVVGSMGNPGP